MILTVKTLKGGKFTVEVDPSNSVAQAKAAIVSFVAIELVEMSAAMAAVVAVATVLHRRDGGGMI
jgi:hypothetical protein